MPGLTHPLRTQPEKSSAQGCKPWLAAQGQAGQGPSQLRRRLLHLADQPPRWQCWKRKSWRGLKKRTLLLLLLSLPVATASETQKILLPTPPGSVLLPDLGFNALEAPPAVSRVLYGGNDAEGRMAAVLSHAYCLGGGRASAAAATLNGEQAALLRRKRVNTTECILVPISEHVA